MAAPKEVGRTSPRVTPALDNLGCLPQTTCQQPGVVCEHAAQGTRCGNRG